MGFFVARESREVPMGIMADALDVEVAPKPHEAVLHLHLLDRCNLRCRHCYMEAASDGKRFLRSDVVGRTLRETERLGIRTVYLTGGEPFLHPDVAEILSSAEAGKSFHLVVCSNGTLIGPGEAALLKACGASVQVSIDGEESFHDRFRGVPGAFRATSEGIKSLRVASVPVSVVVTLCQDNFGSLAWLAEWAAGMGVEHISVQPLQEVGRGIELRQMRLSHDQMCDLFLRVSDLGVHYRQRGLRFSLNYRAKSYLLAHPCTAYVCNGAACHRGVAKEIKTLVVREDGTVLPEIPTLDPRFALGNLYDAPLVELVRRYFADGYQNFHALCRTLFMELIPDYPAPIVPWDELLSERSWTFKRPASEIAVPVQ